MSEDDWYGPNPEIMTPLPTLEDLVQGQLPAGAFILSADLPAESATSMSQFAKDVLLMVSKWPRERTNAKGINHGASREMKAEYSSDTALIFGLDDFYSPSSSYCNGS